MSIQYVILGYLNWKPMSGYDLKKIISQSEILPWSANNNQIYSALVRLHNAQWVDKTVETQTGSPNRHIYSITESGRQALSDWVRSPPEPPEIKKPFLHQMMWADDLDSQSIDELLEAYLNEVGEKLFILRVQAAEGPHKPGRTDRERFIWDMIYKSWIAQYEAEMAWIRQLRLDLEKMAAGFRY